MSHSTPPLPKIYLARHGETEWSLSGQHTGRTDIPLTARGEVNAGQLGERIAGIKFTEVLTSPLQRAKRTCELAGFGSICKEEPDLLEWHYGEYDGKLSKEIQAKAPGWNVFRDGCPGGESPSEVEARTKRLVARFQKSQGDMLVFSHGHFLRSLAATWLGQSLEFGRYLLLGAGALCILSNDHKRVDEPAILLWNDIGHIKN